MRSARTRRRALLGIALAAAAVLAGAAYGVVRELVVGDPAPNEVRNQPVLFGHSGELIPVPHPDDPQLEDARVAAVLESSVGRVYAFSSRNARGLCISTWIEGDRGYQGRLNLSSVCGSRDKSFYVSGESDYHGEQVLLFAGRVGDGVARLALAFPDETVEVPLTGRTFLAELTERPTLFVSYARDGRELERRPFPSASPAASPVRPPYQVTSARELIRIQARGGTEEVRLYVARASDGGLCQIVRAEHTPSNRGCSIPQPRASEIGVHAMSFGGTPGGILLLVGPVGSRVAALELRHEDGRLATIPIRSGWVLYEVRRRDYVSGRRPAELIGRAESGKVLDTKKLPWITP